MAQKMAEKAEELAGVIDFVEKNLPGATKRDARAFVYLLDGIMDLVRKYGIYTVEQALVKNIKRVEAEAAERGDTTVEEEVKDA